MKIFVKNSFVVLFFFFFLGGASSAWAAWNDTSWKMSLKVFCQVFSILTGDFGLLLGFVLALNGLYMIVTKNAAKAGWISLVFGALLTALPGIITTSFSGAGALLNSSGVSQFAGSPLAYAVELSRGGWDSCKSITVDFSAYDPSSAGFSSSGAAGMSGYYTGKGDSGTGIAGVAGGAGGDGTASAFIPAAGECPANSACLSAVGSNRGTTMVPSNGKINSCVGPRNAKLTAGHQRPSKNHKGIDISCSASHVPIMAQRGGTVSAVGCMACGRGYGCCTVIKVGDDYDYYMHQDGNPERLGAAAGQGGSISSGQRVGTCGGNGVAPGSVDVHLHYEIRNGALPPCNRRDPITVM